MRLVKYSVIAAAVLSLSACKSEVEHRPVNDLVVDTLSVGAPVESQYRNFNGLVVPAELTPLAFRVDGELAAVFVREGDNVRKGQVVALLKDAKQKQNLDDAQAKYELALKQFKRGEGLLRNKMISSAELDQLRASYKLAQANLEAAHARESYTRLTAPFDGVVSDVAKDKYESVAPGEVVMSVYMDSQVYVKINISDSVLAMLNPKIRSDRYQPQVRFSGHETGYTMAYLEHTTELHPQSQSYEFWLSMPQVTPAILPGTSAKVAVDLVQAGLNTAQGYQLPMTAIDAGTNRNSFFVWKLQQGEAHRYPVTVEQINGQGALISKGIHQGDVVINSNLRKLRDGMEVKGAEL